MTQIAFIHIFSLNSICTMKLMPWFFCGDYNGRIGKCDDVNLDVDKDVVKRISIDTVKNAHGDALLEFIADGKLAILNGRVDPNNDNYTFISSRGKSVVDY